MSSALSMFATALTTNPFTSTGYVRVPVSYGMDALFRFITDLGLFAAILAGFAAHVSYRANPLREVNRYFAAFAATCALWQLDVAMARSTGDYGIWGVIAAPFGGLLMIMLFVCHSAAIDPHLRLYQRIGSNYWAMVAAVIFVIGALLAYGVIFGGPAPRWASVCMRIACVITMGFAFWQSLKRRRESKNFNPYEIFLINAISIGMVLLFAIFMLFRSPVGSRIMSGVCMLLFASTIWLLLSEQILDVKGTAKVAVGHFLAFAAHLVLTVASIYIFTYLGGKLTEVPPWQFALLGLVINYPLFLFSQSRIRRLLAALLPRELQETREKAIAIATTATSEFAIVAQLAKLAKNVLQGLVVDVVPYPLTARPSAGVSQRDYLAQITRSGWLSPELALRQFRGKELDSVLDAFRTERLGAIIKHNAGDFVLIMFITQRGGGLKSIRGDEITFLQELASIGAAGIGRVRAIEQSVRARGLAVVGRLVAHYSHSARNSLEAIITALEAVRDGQEAKLSSGFRNAVYQEALDLAASHNLALEITRLRPDQVKIAPCPIRPLLDGIVETSALGLGPRATVSVELEDESLSGTADVRVLRQVILNLVRNGIEAASASAPEPRITLSAKANNGSVHIDVIDNGRGVPAEIHEMIFSPWVTTKGEKGTGLGLSFCDEAMRTMHGEIAYMTPRGEPNACFRLTLPAVTSERKARRIANSTAIAGSSGKDS